MPQFAHIQEVLDFLNGRISGDLDGTKFEKISIKAASPKKFVVKGWVSENKGPMVKFSCLWGQLSDGQAYFQETPQSPIEDTHEINIDLKGKKLIIDFEREDGIDHKATFVAS